MKKHLLTFYFIIIAGIANASENPPTIKLGGETHIQYFFRNQNTYYNNAQDVKSATVNLGTRGVNSALVNRNKITIRIINTSSLGFKYGGYIRLKTNTDTKIISQVPSDKAYMYVESSLGRMELGSNNSATYKMMVSAASIGSGTGGLWGDITKIISRYSGHDDDASRRFIRYPFGPFDNGWDQNVKKISYFSPELCSFKIGASYIPDTDGKGTLSQARGITKAKNTDYRNLLALAINHNHKVGDFKFTEGLDIEMAEAKKLAVTKHRHNLATWELGARIDYKQFSVVGSYADWGKSATPKIRVAGRKYGVKYWTLGAQYETDKYSTSITYMRSKRANVILDDEIIAGKEDKGFNTQDMLILGADYQLAPGFMPYLEAGFFKAKHGDATIAADKRTNKGSIYLFGTKLKF